MPLVRISLMEGKSADYRRKIGDVVHQAMVDTNNCPPQDCFQLISVYTKGNFLYAPVYLDIPHTDDLVMIQITLNEGRTVELKKFLYKAIAEGLQKAVGLKPQDVFISLVEVRKKTGRSVTVSLSTPVRHSPSVARSVSACDKACAR
jgi:4-oxalocrotonate tautomerase